ncbi:hypothetical protein Pelo_14618 [Pelomyxa schiedti]|nr:hypothetical protein Pelo_14618 [Pelomyxa schiedti]
MTLSWSEFMSEAKRLASCGGNCPTTASGVTLLWQWKTQPHTTVECRGPGCGFLSLRAFLGSQERPTITSREQDDEGDWCLPPEDNDDGSVSAEPLVCNADTITATSTSDSAAATADVVEVHVVHSSAYQVPVLYCSHLLPIRQLARLARGEGTGGPVWATVTQVDHPVLDIPFYEVHPCGTAGFMGDLEGARRGICGASWDLGGDRDRGAGVGGSAEGEGEDRARWYMLAWMSWVLPIVGLHIDSSNCFH